MPVPITAIVELYLSGQWVDITTDVRVVSGGIAINRGRSNEGTQPDPGRCLLAINNRDGRYSPRNPTSPYYGVLGRNTPIRVSRLAGDPALFVPREGRATTPDHSSLDITGDIDVRIELELEDWRGEAGLAGKYTTTGDERSWALAMDATSLFLLWSPDGTEDELMAISTAPPPAPGGGRQAVRAVLDVNNGSGGHTVTFYTAPSLSGPWTQLGDPVVESGTTSIYSSTAVVQVGDVAGLEIGSIDGRVHAFELRNSSGIVVASPDFGAQTPGTTSFSDGAGRTWTVVSPAEVTDRRFRFYGEVSSWPPRWDVTGNDVWTPIEAAGVLRRLGQGSPVLGSALYRGRVRGDDVVAYWPFEDAAGSTSMAPALNHQPMIVIGTPDLASFDGFISSAPLPVLKGAEMRGSAPGYVDTGETQLRFLLAVPADGAENGQTLVMWYGTGTVRRWEVFYATGGALGLRAFDAGGAELFTTGNVSYAANGKLLLVSIELEQNGANISYALATVEPAAGEGLATTGTLSSNTVGRVGIVTVSPGGGVAEVTIGHVSVQNVVTSLFDEGSELAAWAGETAGRRIQRLCAEEGVALRSIGDLDDTTRLGPQRPAPLLDLIRQAADADDGVLYEPRGALAVGYRTRVSLYNQAAGLALDYAAKHLVPPLEPVDDDQNLRNDITAQREGGSSARAVLEDGPLSIQPPPAGVGRYDDQVTISVQYDADLADQANWRLRLGTVDEARYPQVSVNLRGEAFRADAALVGAALGVDGGDLLTIDNPPPWLPPEQIAQIVQGYNEDLTSHEHRLTYNCSPASPYAVATFGGGARYGPVDTVTAEALDSTETGVDITTPTGPLWSTSATGYDVLIGGERMTVTAVGSPSGVNQTLTVVRSVNGVAKSHAAGAEVRMFEPAVYAL